MRMATSTIHIINCASVNRGRSQDIPDGRPISKIQTPNASSDCRIISDRGISNHATGSIRLTLEDSANDTRDTPSHGAIVFIVERIERITSQGQVVGYVGTTIEG